MDAEVAERGSRGRGCPMGVAWCLWLGWGVRAREDCKQRCTETGHDNRE